MKLNFRGANRMVKNHPFETNLHWESSDKVRCVGRLKGVGLTGAFNLTITFDDKEIECALEEMLAISPEKALKLCSRIQAEAICILSEKPKS